MKSVMISIRPEWCAKIASGKKTVEVRKTAPKLPAPFKCYIYCTNTKPFLVWGDVFRGNWETEITTLSGYNRKEAEKIWDVFNGKVMGEFICDRITPATVDHIKDIAKAACLSLPDMWEYGRKSSAFDLFGWHISKLEIYDTPKPLSEFRRSCVNDLYCEECGMYRENTGTCGNSALQLSRPPQSWCYVEELQ